MQIDTNAQSLSESEATEILESIYEIYFQRPIDPSGREHWTPIVTKYGFQGLAFVIFQLLQSTEMNERVQKELSSLYRDLLGRELDPVARQTYDLPVRFFRERGRREVSEIIQKSPDYARRRIELKPVEEEIEAISNEIRKGNASSETHANLGRLYSTVHRYEAAIEEYTKATELDENPAYFFEKANLFLKLEKYQDAIDFFRTAETKGYQPSGDIHFSIAQAFEKLGNLEQSLTEYELAVKDAPHEPALVWYEFGIVQQKLSRVTEGIESFQRALESHPTAELEARILGERARAYMRLGQVEKAGRDFAGFVGRTRTWKRLIQATGPTVFFVENATKHAIPDPPTLNYIALEHQLQILERVSTIEMNAYPEGESISSVLTLRIVQDSVDRAAFLVDGGKRRWIPNPETFITLGLDLAKVETLSQEEMKTIPTGRPIRNVLGKQPLKRSQQTGKYSIIEMGQRREIPNIQTLVALGYSDEEMEELPEEAVNSIKKGQNIPDLSALASL